MNSRDIEVVYTDACSSGEGDGEAWFRNPVWFAKELDDGKISARKITGVISGVFVTEAVGGETFGSREECEAVFSFRDAPVMFLSPCNEMSPDDPEVLGFVLGNNSGLRAEDCL